MGPDPNLTRDPRLWRAVFLVEGQEAASQNRLLSITYMTQSVSPTPPLEKQGKRGGAPGNLPEASFTRFWGAGGGGGGSSLHL